MKIPSTVILLLGAAVATTVASGQATNQSSMLVCGQATNGIRAEVELISCNGRLTNIVVWANHVTDTNFVPVLDLEKLRKHEMEYYMPTNCFCGPVELRDSTGRVLHELKPDLSFRAASERDLPPVVDVSSLAAYPATYSLEAAYGNYFRRFIFFNGLTPFPMPLFVTSPRSDLVRFQLGAKKPYPTATLYQRCFELENYFDLSKPGQYKFTVWPKIYQRTATNHDLCRRIDLPPVTATFEWSGEKQN